MIILRVRLTTQNISYVIFIKPDMPSIYIYIYAFQIIENKINITKYLICYFYEVCY